MPTVNIQGIDCTYRELWDGENILYENLPQEEQFFRRIECPFDDDDWIEIVAVPFDERMGKYTKELSRS